MNRAAGLGERVLPRLDTTSRVLGATDATRARHARRYAAMSDAELAEACKQVAVSRGDIWRESPSLAALLDEAAKRLESGPK